MLSPSHWQPASVESLPVCIFLLTFVQLDDQQRWFRTSRSIGHAAAACEGLCYLTGSLTMATLLQVTFLGVSKKFTICQEAKQVNTKQNLHFECLEPHHFVPEIVETYPYEQLSHAVLNWVEENADRCDVIHGHEWGGAFVDLITANNHRQVCSCAICRTVEPYTGLTEIPQLLKGAHALQSGVNRLGSTVRKHRMQTCS